jgi:hypothetical protein
MTAAAGASTIRSAMSIDDRPDRGFLREVAEDIERRAERDRRRLAQERDSAAVVALEAELLLLRRAARAAERQLQRRDENR